MCRDLSYTSRDASTSCDRLTEAARCGEKKQIPATRRDAGFIALCIDGGDGNTAGVPSKKKASSCENCRREAGLCSEPVVEGYCKHTLQQICFQVQVQRH